MKMNFIKVFILSHGKYPMSSTCSSPCLTHHHHGGRVGGEKILKVALEQKVLYRVMGP